ncbi:MAG TPA: D-alanine--D-alanine ligase [Microbacteriaceae bacterium]|nr:D-alanine--D-alanine ligase [Microbacteriaceae bacterium]
MKIVVISGGISHERDISLRSGRRVADALADAGHEVHVLEPDPQLLSRIESLAPAAIVPMVHGASGEDGSLLALLELAGRPYLGSSAQSARLAWSKPAARDRIAECGVAVPEGFVLTRESFRELSAQSILQLLGSTVRFPLVVKPGSGGSSQGVSIVADATGLARALVEAFTYADVALCERWIPGNEVAVSVWRDEVGLRALPPVEIAPQDGIYDFEARYNAGETTFFIPARLEPTAIAALGDAAVRVHRELGLGDFSRVDFIVDDAGTPWFLEANVIPGFTETSLFPLALGGADLTLTEAFDRAVRAVTERAH